MQGDDGTREDGERSGSRYARPSVSGGENDSLAIISRMIEPGSIVLDLGTAEGALGEALARKGCTVDGVELDDAAADVARRHYRRVECIDLEGAALADLRYEETYDYVVCADVLEHLRNPAKLLGVARSWLRPGGELVVSVPNVGYAGVLLDLLHGRFQYGELGILDRTHLRFYTRDSVIRLLADSGFGVEEIHPVRVELRNSEFRDRVTAYSPERITQALEALPDALAYQWVLRARPREGAVLVGPGPDFSSGAELTFETRLYWRAPGEEYSETRSAAASLPAGGGADTLLVIPPGDKAALRWDATDRAGIIRVDELLLLNYRDEEVWRAGMEVFRGTHFHELLPLGTSTVPLFISTGADPWMELPVPEPVLEQLRGGGAMSVKVAMERPDEARALLQQERATEARLETVVRDIERSVANRLGALEQRLDQLTSSLESATESFRAMADQTSEQLSELKDSSRLLEQVQHRALQLLGEVTASTERTFEGRARRAWRRLLGRGYRLRRELVSRTYTFEHVPVAQLMKIDGSRWRSLGVDPQFEMRSDSGKIPYGLVRIRSSVHASGDEAPVLYFDAGEGFREHERIQLTADESPALIRLPHGIHRLRLDPRSSPGEVVVGDFVIEEISFGELLKDAALSRLSSSVGRVHRPVRPLPAFGLRALLSKGLATVSGGLDVQEDVGQRSYGSWVRTFSLLSDRDRENVLKAIATCQYLPMVSVVMPVWNTPERFLRRAVDSVREQIYPHWELCLVDDASTSASVRRILADYVDSEPRIRLHRREQNGHISRASNDGLAMAKGEFVAFLDHDDELAPEALAQVVWALNREPGLEIIYTDEDKIDANGFRFDPAFKPEWSPERLLASNYACHLCVYRTELVRSVGGLREGFEGSQDHDLILRASAGVSPEQISHLPFVLYHWRSIPGSTASAPNEKPYTAAAGLRAVQEALDRSGATATVEHGAVANTYRVKRRPAGSTLVSIIIPTRDQADLLRQCIESIRQKTSYRNFEILVVDNQSSSPDALAYLKSLEDSAAAKVLRYSHPFNYSAINNFAVRAAQGQMVALLNNDIEVISEGWLEEMVSLAGSRGVGAVGAKLLFPDGSIQHAGVVGGLFGVAGHLYKHQPPSALGSFGELTFAREVLAVTAACMVVSRSTWDEAGGLNEEDLKVAFNDVDFCFRLARKGYRNVWTPHAELFHHESVSRGSDERPGRKAAFHSEIEYMRRTWPEYLRADPYHSLNLSLDSQLPQLAWPPRVRPFFRLSEPTAVRVGGVDVPA